MGTLQDAVAGGWERISDGCVCNRRSLRLIRFHPPSYTLSLIHTNAPIISGVAIPLEVHLLLLNAKPCTTNPQP